jgi:hypothetical protein
VRRIPSSAAAEEALVALDRGSDGEEGRQLGQMPAVDLGERVGELGRRVTGGPEDGQPSARSQDRGRVGGPRERIHRVPGLTGDDGVERPADRVPRLERGDLDVDSPPSRGLGHPGIDVHTQHLAAGGLKLPGDDASTAADVEHVSARHLVDEVTDRVGGIARAGAVVSLRIGPERLRPLAVPVRLLVAVDAGHGPTLPLR